jgi:hypothetical protein
VQSAGNDSRSPASEGAAGPGDGRKKPVGRSKKLLGEEEKNLDHMILDVMVTNLSEEGLQINLITLPL